MGMELTRRFQSIAGVISIIPGPTSIFRNDIFAQLQFGGDALCEDFDVTMQIHRQKLGSIQYIPKAIAAINPITDQTRGIANMMIPGRRSDQRRIPKVKIVVGQGRPKPGASGNWWPIQKPASG